MSQPPDRTDSFNPFDPFGLWKESQQTILESWSKAMTDAVNTEAYAETSGRMLDMYLTAAAPLRAIIEQTMTQLLNQLSLPSRAEVLSLAERLTNIELRLDDLDARLDVIQRGVERTASAVVALSAQTTTPMSAAEGGEPHNGTQPKKRTSANKRNAETGAHTTTRTTQTKRGSAAKARGTTE